MSNEISTAPENTETTGTVDREALREQIIEQISTVYDPEIPVNIYSLGLIYDVDIDDDYLVTVQMTLTSPNCPEAESLPGEVESKVAAVKGVAGAKIDLVWEPAWTPQNMSEEAKLELGWME